MRNRNFNEWGVALVVIACSAVLFVALALALTGRTLAKPARTLKVNFHDATGIKVSSQVKYAGAPAGAVIGIRMLTLQEREASGDPHNAVQATFSLSSDVPILKKGALVSISADTLLSDKFVLISAGDPASPDMSPDDTLQGISPVTFDELSRSVDGAVKGLRKVLGGSGGQADALITRIDSLVNQTEQVVGDAAVLMKDSRELIASNKDQIASTIVRLDKAATALESLAVRGEAIIKKNEGNVNGALGDLRVTSENLKVTSTYAKFLLRDLSDRPSRLIWGGGKPPALPSEQQILKARQPIPMQ